MQPKKTYGGQANKSLLVEVFKNGKGLVDFFLTNELSVCLVSSPTMFSNRLIKKEKCVVEW